MSYIGAAVIVVLLYLLTPMSGKTLFKCQGEYVILEFEKEEYHGGTVTWHKFLTDGNNELIARKVEDEEPYVYANFSHYAEIDRDLNLILRNVSSESSGEYFRRIINGGIFNSSVNLYVMYAPSGKPIVSKEKSGSGKESFNLQMPYLGKPEANVTIKPLKMNITNVAGAIQQYEICLSGRSLQCLEESPCQNFTIRIGQGRIPMQDVEKVLTWTDTVVRVKHSIHVAIVIITCCVIAIYHHNKLGKPLLKGKYFIGFWIVCVVFGVSAAIGFIMYKQYVMYLFVWETCLIFVSQMGFMIIVIRLVRKSAEAGAMEAKETFLGTSEDGNTEKTSDGKKKKKQKTTLRTSETADAEEAGAMEATELLLGTSEAGNPEKTSDGKKKKKQKTTLRTSETADAEEAGAMEATELLLGTSEAGNPERQNSKGDSKRLAFEIKQIGVDKTGQNDDIKPGSSHSV